MSLSGVSIAFSANAYVASPSWTSIDSYVQSWSIRRGRSDELGTMATGSAEIVLRDLNGTFDPTNITSPYFNELDPDRQIKIELTNPVTSAVKVLFRGYIESLSNTLDVSERLSVVTITAVDVMDKLANTEIVADLTKFGGTTAYTTAGSVDTGSASLQYAAAQVDDRIKALLLDAGWADSNWTILTGNVAVQAVTYSTSDTTLQAIQDAANAEFPGVAVFFISKTGIPTFYGRLARFNPTDPTYPIASWKCGDVASAVSDPSHIALISALTFPRDSAYIYNQVTAYPNGIAGADIPGQTVYDTTSIADHGIRALSFENLIVAAGDEAGTPDANAECLVFATYYVNNYATPQTRISQVEFLLGGQTSGNIATALWKLGTEIELSDVLHVTTAHPGGGGFDADFFVEGLTYQAEPMNASNPNVTLTVDISPAAYFPTGDDPFG